MAKKEVSLVRRVPGMSWIIPPTTNLKGNGCGNFSCANFGCQNYTCTEFEGFAS